jgi:CheY-like chemotaxis protein
MVKNVLIVDDDQEMLTSLENGLLKYKESFSVLKAEDGLDAVEKLKNNIISLVVTDLKMPRMDGFALLQHIMEDYPDIPVIIITGYSTPEMERLARKGGAIGYIAKPFILENLARNIITTLRKESEGGTLHSVSSGIFLQLMEMEQKTCTIRLEDKNFGKKGVLFFKDGELLDARVNNLQGKAAAYEIFSWDKVTISIQNECPNMDNKIQSELQPLILEATRLRDEAGHPEEPETTPEKVKAEKVAASDLTEEVKLTLEKEIGPRGGIEEIYQDNSWSGLIEEMLNVGTFFEAGKLKIGYIDKGESKDFILLPDREITVISVSPKCPRDKIIQVLSK